MTGTPHRELVWGTFPQLEATFIAQMKQLRAASRLKPCAVLVANDLLRAHLPRALADAGRPHANIRFLTFRHLAARLAAPRLQQLAVSGMPPFCAELALGQAVKTLSQRIRYFAPVADREGFRHALLETFRDLKEAGLAPQDLRHLARRMQRKADRILKTKLSEVGLLWEHVEQMKRRLRFHDEADLLEAAAQEADKSRLLSGLSAFIVYGLYDLTGSQQRLLEACLAGLPATVYLPYDGSDAFRYARPTLEWFVRLGFTPTAAGRVNVAERNGVETILISAPGEAREVEEVIREVFHPLEPTRGSDDERIGILLRSRLPYAELLQDALDGVEKGLGHFRHGAPLARTREGKALLLLSELVGSRLRRAPVMDFITTAGIKPSSTGDEPSPQARAADWNQLSIEAGIVEGRREWTARLARLADSLKSKARRVASAEDRRQAERKLESLTALREYLATLFSGLESVSAQRTWRGMAASLAGLYAETVPSGEHAESVTETLRVISRLDLVGEPATGEQLRAFLRQALEQTSPPQGRFQRNEPTVAALMEARGVPFDVVIVPGMVEKGFPQTARQDPILLDAERIRVTQILAQEGRQVALPLKRRRREEEELLFALAVQAARRRLVLTYPRLDPGTARPRIASHFLLRVVEAMTGAPADYGALEKFIRDDARGRFVRLSRLDPAVRDRAVSALEYDLSSLGKARDEDTPDALSYLTQETPFFAQALRAESARWEKPDFSEYDGVLRSAEARERLAELLGEQQATVAPTRLEEYARCPFAYFLESVFHVEPVEEPERVPTISPSDRGTLIHGILWQFLSEAVRNGRVPLTEALWPRLESIARARFTAFQQVGVSGYPLMWRVETDRILADLHEFLKHEAGVESGFAPAHFEVRFGMPPHEKEESPLSTEEPVQFDLGDGSAIRFCGKMDRIDLDASSGRSRVLDYKTGSARRLADDRFDGGKAIQLPVYILAAQQLLPNHPPDHAEYYFATTKGKWKRILFTTTDWPRKADTLRTIVRTILDGIRAGRFYARPEDDHCKWCDFRLACGHARSLDFKWAADRRTTAAFREMAKID